MLAGGFYKIATLKSTINASYTKRITTEIILLNWQALKNKTYGAQLMLPPPLDGGPVLMKPLCCCVAGPQECSRAVLASFHALNTIKLSHHNVSVAVQEIDLEANQIIQMTGPFSTSAPRYCKESAPLCLSKSSQRHIVAATSGSD